MTYKVIQEVRQKEHCKFIYESPCVSASGCFNILSPRFPLLWKIPRHALQKKRFSTFYENVF